MRQPQAEQLTEVLLTPRDVAERLQISEKSVRRLVHAGRMPARVVVGKIRLCWPEVVASLPLAPASASGRASEPGVVALDLTTRLRLKSQYFYRNSRSDQPGGAA